MKLLKQLIHPELTSREGRTLRRHAARGIVLREDEILLLFTERYNDFSLPGGGVDQDEDITLALKRELEEETGARDIQIKEHYGFIEEYRPHYKPEFDLMHMTSHFFTCDVAPKLAATRMEGYEVANGMRPLWVPISDAVKHNRQVMARKEKTMGQSIQRETFMLERISKELIPVEQNEN
ncbi:NUDIX domain-containing protein [Marinospirillum celere]|uniref:NUDIX domain-containing protein n=1 Tax=Marinospirillum celere TaxID=1122252 RepID=A0A1I1GSR2_9GAMM|nr:NUDIX domain-containing protein [Marinospirillum celere]SFC12908.1 NUDIX domain-containing protein [Marinospirillum celere]